MRTKALAALSLLLFIALGVGTYLSLQRQDIRQQASESSSEITQADFTSFPVYPGANLEEQEEEVLAGQTQYKAEWKTSSSVYEVAQFYMNVLPQSGWTIVQPAEGSERALEQIIIIEKNGRKAYVSIETHAYEGPDTEIALEIPVVVTE